MDFVKKVCFSLLLLTLFVVAIVEPLSCFMFVLFFGLSFTLFDVMV